MGKTVVITTEQQPAVDELLGEAEQLWLTDPFDVKLEDWQTLLVRAYRLGRIHAQTAG